MCHDEMAAKGKRQLAVFTCSIPSGATGPLISGRYRDLGDGTLLDIRTGLQWMRCALGQRWSGRTCAGDAGKWTWNNLNDQVRGINQQGGYGGHTF